MSRWNFKIEIICLIFDYRVYFLHVNENTGTFPHINSFSLTSAYKCITFPQRLGAEACYPLHHRKPEVLSFFFFCPENFIVSTQQTRYGGERGRYKPRDRQTGVVSFIFQP